MHSNFLIMKTQIISRLVIPKHTFPVICTDSQIDSEAK